MPWWGWIVVGAVLLGAELGLVDADFYLVFLGVSALVVGGAVFVAPGLPTWIQWLAFAALAVTSMVGFRARVYDKLRGSPAGFGDGVVGETATASEPIAPGANGRGELRGTVWTLRNVGPEPVGPGDRVRVVAAHGLTLDVRAPET